MTDYGVVFMTTSSREEAEKIAGHLVEKRLVACAQIVSEIQSIYWWQGKICNDKEVLFTAKTTARLFSELVKEVKELHSYEIPEIIFVPIQQGSQDYLGWISEVTKRA